MSVTVFARTNAIAATLKHANGMPFNLATNSAVWPDDQFTARRIADGDVFLAPTQGLVPAGQLSIQQVRPQPATTSPTVVKTGP